MSVESPAATANGTRAGRTDWPCNSQMLSLQSNTSNTVIKFMFVSLHTFSRV